jgi:hypothetical protein
MFHGVGWQWHDQEQSLIDDGTITEEFWAEDEEDDEY